MHKFKLLISLVIFGYGAYIIGQHLFDKSVPVPAVVTQSYEEFRKLTADQPGKYHYTFEYEYTYSDQNYVSNRYTYAGRDTSEAVCTYKAGDSVIAYVDPNNPAYSVIKREVSGFVYALTAIGLLMLIQTILTYMIDTNKTGSSELVQKANNVISPLIGITVLFGGIGYFIYTLILAATAQCVN